MTDLDFLETTRASYDAVAVEYAEQSEGELRNKPWDRAVLAAFADLVAANGSGPVADIGCGPGSVTAHLATLGLDVFGIDLSPEMLAVAHLPAAFAEFHRVLAPGGHVMLALYLLARKS